MWSVYNVTLLCYRLQIGGHAQQDADVRREKGGQVIDTVADEYL
jgi:hypothetical protein